MPLEKQRLRSELEMALQKVSVLSHRNMMTQRLRNEFEIALLEFFFLSHGNMIIVYIR